MSNFPNWQIPPYVCEISATQLENTSVPLENLDAIHQMCHIHLTSTFHTHMLHITFNKIGNLLQPRFSLVSY